MKRDELLRLAGKVDEADPRLNVRRRTRTFLQLWRQGSYYRENFAFDDDAGAPVEYVRAVRLAADFCAGPASAPPWTEVAVVRGLLPWPFGGTGR